MQLEFQCSAPWSFQSFIYFVDLRQNEKEINLKVSQKKL